MLHQPINTWGWTVFYIKFVGGFTAGEVVAEAIEHLEAFKNNNHFLLGRVHGFTQPLRPTKLIMI